MSKTAIFLGAGASKADGAPLQYELISEMIKLIQEDTIDVKPHLRTFFLIFFEIDIQDTLINRDYPSFEEILGVIDISIERGESYKDFQHHPLARNSDNPVLVQVREYLVYYMAQVIKKKLEGENIYHTKLIKNLKDKNILEKVCFISTNYDILIDNALGSLDNIGTTDYKNIDYGIKFSNYNQKGFNIPLYKVHGSLNWLYCPVCKTMKLTPYEKSAFYLIDLINENNLTICNMCGINSISVIIPPTYFKDMRNHFISTIWNSLEQDLHIIDHIIICGYSMPDADFHVKYLLKKAQIYRNNDVRFTIINDYKDKTDYNRKEEEIRFKRFLGSKVEYSHKSFEDFADKPEEFIK